MKSALGLGLFATVALLIGSTVVAVGMEEDRLKQLLAAEPATATTCLEMLDTVQVRAEERVTTLNYDDQAIEKIGAMIALVEQQCQASLFKDAWTNAVTLSQQMEPPPTP